MLEGTSGHHLVQPSAKKGSLEQVTQEGMQADFKYLQKRRLHGLSEQPMPVLCKPRSFPHIHMELPVFQFVLVTSCFLIGQH